MHDVIIIGGGHNGLVAAAFLAKAGLKPLVLERAERIGGCAITSEIAPGLPLSDARAPGGDRSARIIRALDLERHGLQIVRPAARVCAPAADGRALTLWADAARAAREIAAFSPADAERYPAIPVQRRCGQRRAADADARRCRRPIDHLVGGRR